jgi:hypothetical protein
LSRACYPGLLTKSRKRGRDFGDSRRHESVARRGSEPTCDLDDASLTEDLQVVRNRWLREVKVIAKRFDSRVLEARQPLDDGQPCGVSESLQLGRQVVTNARLRRGVARSNTPWPDTMCVLDARSAIHLVGLKSGGLSHPNEVVKLTSHLTQAILFFPLLPRFVAASACVADRGSSSVRSTPRALVRSVDQRMAVGAQRLEIRRIVV